MDANDFVKMVKELVVSKKLEWSSFRENRIYEIGNKLKNGKVDIEQAIKQISDELKSYNISRDDIKMLNDKLKK